MSADSAGGRDWSSYLARQRERLSGAAEFADGGEPGRADPAGFETAGFETAGLRLLLARLSSYADTRPAIGHRLLYWAARQVPGVYPDLAWLPGARDEDLLARAGAPLWLASGAHRGAAEFDVLAISISVPQEALNLPALLAGSGVELDGRARLADPDQPLVLLGGQAAGAVPFVHGPAGPAPDSGGLADAVCFGDGVLWLQEFLAAYGAARAAGIAKTEFLARLAADLPGTYVPGLYEHAFEAGRLAAVRPAHPGAPWPVRFRCEPAQAWLAGYDGAFVPFAEEDEEETLPLALGCAFRCRFCQTGWLRSDPGLAGPEEYVAAARRLKAALAASDLNLLAPDAASYPGLPQLAEHLLDLFPHVSLKSLSVSSLAASGPLSTLAARLGKHELTLGIEGASARLRRWLGKPLAGERAAEVVRRAAGDGLRQVKLFFIATGLEEESDLAAFSELLAAVRRAASGARRIASFTPLFAAPHTPLEFAPLTPVASMLASSLEARAAAAGFELRWSAAPAEVRLSALLARAGRAATPALVRLSLAGHRYRDGLRPATIAAAGERLAEAGLDLAALAEEVGPDQPLAWDDLEAAAPRADLRRAYEKARAELAAAGSGTDPEAGPPARRPPVPTPLSAHLPARPLPSAVSPPAPVPETRLAFWAWTAPADAPRPRVTVARGLLRQLLAAWPAGVEGYRGRPALAVPAGASGLALLAADFRSGRRPPDIAPPHERPPGPGPEPTAGLLAGPLAGPPPDPERLVFLLRCPAVAPGSLVTGLAAALARHGVRHQVTGRGGRRWLIVAKGYRRKTGLVAARDEPDGGGLALAGPGFDLPTSPAPWLALAAYLDAGGRCPHCRAPLYSPLFAAVPTDWPACPDCGRL